MALLEVRHVAASFPRKGATVQLFADISFALEESMIYDLVGPSGSGKSTLLRVCALLLNRDKGELLLQGQSSEAMRPTAWRKQVCLVPQKPSLVAGTVRDNLVLPWTFKARAGEVPPDDAHLRDLLAKADLPEIELTRDISQLSGGQAARVALLRAFATKPAVLLLDEVDAALDSESSHSIGRLTQTLVGPCMTCLRIRHRASDGLAAGTFTLRDGSLTYATGEVVVR